jgi:hypothetical protein
MAFPMADKGRCRADLPLSIALKGFDVQDLP